MSGIIEDGSDRRATVEPWIWTNVSARSALVCLKRNAIEACVVQESSWWTSCSSPPSRALSAHYGIGAFVCQVGQLPVPGKVLEALSACCHSRRRAKRISVSPGQSQNRLRAE